MQKLLALMVFCCVSLLLGMEQQELSQQSQPAVHCEVELKAYDKDPQLKRWSKLPYEQVCDYIKGGAILYKKIVEKTAEKVAQFDRVAELKNRVSLCWFFYSIALASKKPYYNGMTVLEDTPEIALFSYFHDYVQKTTDDSHKKPCLYATNLFSSQRVSTHFAQEQKTYPHYGIDVRWDDKEWSSYDLPSGCSHILFGKLDERRFFIKMEDHGIYYAELPGHIVGMGGSVARKALPVMVGKKFASKIITLNEGSYLQKEHLPHDRVDDYKKICSENTIERQPVKTIADIMEHTKKHQAFELLREAIIKEYTYPEERYGNEIIIHLTDGQQTAQWYADK